MQLRGPGQWLELAEEKLSSYQTRPALTLSLSLALMGELEHSAQSSAADQSVQQPQTETDMAHFCCYVGDLKMGVEGIDSL